MSSEFNNACTGLFQLKPLIEPILYSVKFTHIIHYLFQITGRLMQSISINKVNVQNEKLKYAEFFESWL